MTRTLGILMALSVAGCHLVLDPDQYRLEFDGGPDAPLPDSASPDVNQQLLAVDSVEPAEAFEGQGSFAGGPGVAILVHGMSISTDATLTVSGVDGATVEQVAVSSDGSVLAAVLRLPVDTNHGQGAPDETLTLTVTQGSPQVTAMTTLTVHPLDELVLVGTTNDAAMFKPRYSTITTNATATLRGPTLARLHATSSIVVSEAVDASAGSTNTPGAGGCAGGGSAQNGGCGLSGGTGGATAQTLTVGKGGGGGGASTAGSVGGGGASGGMASGDGNLAPFVGGNGGGGGGNGGVLLGISDPGGTGGAGGGAIELDSEGSLSVSAALSANGSAGGHGASGCSSQGGGGGGGSGGSLLLRGAGQVVVSQALRATGGTGGAESQAGCGNGGGSGAAGFIRIDAPAATLGSLDAMPAPVRGPMWAPDTRQIVATANVELTFFGTPNHAYGYSVGDNAVTGARPLSSGSARITVTLPPRTLTSVCVYVSENLAGEQLNLPEAKNCRDFVYIP